MIVVTGASGFIGSCLVSKLNQEGFDDLLLVDDFSDGEKQKNLEGKKFSRKLEIKDFLDWFEKNAEKISFIFHIGANSDTTESRKEIFDFYNLNYSKKVWEICAQNQIPLVYASSAATYGDGKEGFDDETLPSKLKPLNLYGESKNNFDKWALGEAVKPPFWAGLKFFNVYGPNEYHKGRMASVVLHTRNQIERCGKMKLFRSHNPKYKDGEQLRDFVYVKDVVEVCLFFMKEKAPSGLYNVGTGKARSFFDLSKSVFEALNKKIEIEFIDIPEDIREKYQYFTEARMEKLRRAEFKKEFYSLEEGVKDYVENYLCLSKYI
ncbi:MAG: ADP-L-glycero-D-manno-heptose 6-epimerase [Patescibacteria group bacterium]|jgi:ADP-L-glycero-D-manno-heptose 6-epimerase|nr:ADP-L-glycero-D-manno-heptose 6-epimerase [Patescibacteria group bacterium]